MLGFPEEAAGGVCAALAMLLMAAASPGDDRPPYSAGPPPAHTGGFSEPTCRACHFDLPLNAASGTVRVDGTPEDMVDAAHPIPLAVTLAQSGMGRAGFQMSARYAGGPERGSQAGEFRVSDSRAEIRTDKGVQYAQHTERGARITSPDTARWRLVWTPPNDPSGSVILHVAANAANDDASEFGDRIFQGSVRIPLE